MKLIPDSLAIRVSRDSKAKEILNKIDEVSQYLYTKPIDVYHLELSILRQSIQNYRGKYRPYFKNCIKELEDKERKLTE